MRDRFCNELDLRSDVRCLTLIGAKGRFDLLDTRERGLNEKCWLEDWLSGDLQVATTTFFPGHAGLSLAVGAVPALKQAKGSLEGSAGSSTFSDFLLTTGLGNGMGGRGQSVIIAIMRDLGRYCLWWYRRQAESQ